MKSFTVFLLILLLFVRCKQGNEQAIIMTVNGPIAASEMGNSLIHEHILVDFIGADSTGNHRWNREEVLQVVSPYLEEIKQQGVQSFIDCTPAYLGRDPLLLKSLSQTSGLHILTNTGYYGAINNKFLPKLAFSESAEELAKRWITEFDNGIENTGIKPGFIKISVAKDSLSLLHKKLIKAAALTHLQTGLTIASHTILAIPALQQIAVLEETGVSPEAFIWVHAQGEKDKSTYILAAKKGTWISLDGINEKNLNNYLKMLVTIKNEGYLNKVLLSHDAGWYSPGEKEGGSFRGYTTLYGKFVPLLRANNFTDAEIKQLLVDNPAEAFTLRIRKH